MKRGNDKSFPLFIFIIQAPWQQIWTGLKFLGILLDSHPDLLI